MVIFWKKYESKIVGILFFAFWINILLRRIFSDKTHPMASEIMFRYIAEKSITFVVIAVILVTIVCIKSLQYKWSKYALWNFFLLDILWETNFRRAVYNSRFFNRFNNFLLFGLMWYLYFVFQMYRHAKEEKNGTQLKRTAGKINNFLLQFGVK